MIRIFAILILIGLILEIYAFRNKINNMLVKKMNDKGEMNARTKLVYAFAAILTMCIVGFVAFSISSGMAEQDRLEKIILNEIDWGLPSNARITVHHDWFRYTGSEIEKIDDMGSNWYGFWGDIVFEGEPWKNIMWAYFWFNEETRGNMIRYEENGVYRYWGE